jgi:hypothetical protein
MKTLTYGVMLVSLHNNNKAANEQTNETNILTSGVMSAILHNNNKEANEQTN